MQYYIIAYIITIMSAIDSSFGTPISEMPAGAAATAPVNKPASSTLTNTLVGPIGVEYCTYFSIVAMLAVFFFILVVAGIVYTGVSKKLGVSFYAIILLYSAQFLLIYLQNRLLYNMCVNSIASNAN